MKEPKWENPPEEDNSPKEGDLRVYIDKAKRWGWWWYLAQYSASVSYKEYKYDYYRGERVKNPRTLSWYSVVSEHREWAHTTNIEEAHHWAFTKAGAERAGQRMITCHNQRIAKFDAQVKDRADREAYRKSLSTVVPMHNATDLR